MKATEFRKLIREEIRKALKEKLQLTEGTIMIFHYAKPYKGADASKLRKEADEYIKFLQSKNFIVHTGSDALYFPDFTWAGGKQKLGNCIGVLAGSETIILSPIGENKTYKFSESLLVRFVKDGRIPAFLLKERVSEERVSEEGVSAEEMKNGIRLDSDNGKMAGSIVRIATTMGFKQGTWNNGTANGDYSFDYDDGDASNSSELVDDNGENSKGYSPSKVFILNSKMQNHPTIQSLIKKAIEWYG